MRAAARATLYALALVAGQERAAGLEACLEDSRVVMGTTATVRACGTAELVLRAAVGEALDEIDRIDRLMSHYRPDSPLSRVNREAARGPVAVDPELFDFLELCLRWSRDSEGAFDVTVGPLMKAWGFFRDEGRVPGEQELAAARARVGHRHVSLDRARRSVRFDREGVEIDLGGIGKGYAVDRAVARLRARGVASALVNLGGSSVYGLGAPPGDEAWSTGIADPTSPEREALRVPLRDRALSVSGGYARSFVKGGVTYAHIMDPRTGRPVSGVLSVAVLSASATDGDALDNVLFVQGLDRARAFVARQKAQPPIEVLFFEPAPQGYRLERFSVPPLATSRP
jgi:thiamine biosynthesis lipoprotein